MPAGLRRGEGSPQWCAGSALQPPNLGRLGFAAAPWTFWVLRPPGPERGLAKGTAQFHLWGLRTGEKPIALCLEGSLVTLESTFSGLDSVPLPLGASVSLAVNFV